MQPPPHQKTPWGRKRALKVIKRPQCCAYQRKRARCASAHARLMTWDRSSATTTCTLWRPLQTPTCGSPGVLCLAPWLATCSSAAQTPDFLCEDRQLLRDIRDSPTRVSTIQLQWVAGTQRPFEYTWASPHTVDPGAAYDALVITVSPDKVAQANFLGHISLWWNNAKFTYNNAMPRLRAGWMHYGHWLLSSCPAPCSGRAGCFFLN